MVKLNLDIDDAFFRDEIRNGYLVTEKQKKIWAVELDLLNKLLQVCHKHDISVCCFAGTMLGAIRHHGFIPWDDDVDVCMTRENYEKLLSIANAEFEFPYFFQTYQTDTKYFFGYARLRNSETTGIICGNESIEYNNGIYIDIFVLDGYIDNTRKYENQVKKIRHAERKIHWYLNNFSNVGIKNKIKHIVGFILRHITSYERLVQNYFLQLTKYNKEADRVSLMTHSSDLTKKYWCYKEDLKNIIYEPFEMLSIPLPANYDAILRNMYGNYMLFPPEEERGVWHKNIIEFDPDIPYTRYLESRIGELDE